MSRDNQAGIGNQLRLIVHHEEAVRIFDLTLPQSATSDQERAVTVAAQAFAAALNDELARARRASTDALVA